MAAPYTAGMFKHLYKVTFLNHGKVYELYCQHVGSSHLWGFTEIGTLVFDVHDGLVIDPTEERLREEFGATKTLHLPMQSIVRIEEVEKKGPIDDPRRGHRREGGHAVPDARQAALSACASWSPTTIRMRCVTCPASRACRRTACRC